MSTQYGSSFTFDGVTTTAHGVWVSGVNTFAAPERDVETVVIPGRNGMLTLDNGRYQNVRIAYPCFMADNFDTDFPAFKAAMLSKTGYLQLSDTYHPDGFRLARIVGGLTPKTGILNKSAQFDVQFDCYPQFYLTTGQSAMTISTSGSNINNPTQFPSNPIIEVTFSSTPRTGTVTVGGQTVTITALPGTPLVIDCEAQTAYFVIQGQVRAPAYQYITLTTGDFPTIPKGTSTVSFTGASSVKITPRWWTL